MAKWGCVCYSVIVDVISFTLTGPIRSISKNMNKTRNHSSRMRTARLGTARALVSLDIIRCHGKMDSRS